MGNAESVGVNGAEQSDDVFNFYLEHLKSNNQKKCSQQKIKEEKARYVNHDKWFRLFKNFDYIGSKPEILYRDRKWHKNLKSIIPVPSIPGSANIVQLHLYDIFQNPDHPFCELLLQFSNLFHATFGQSKGRTRRKKRRKSRSKKRGPAQDFNRLPRRRSAQHGYLKMAPRDILKLAAKDVNGFVARFGQLLATVFPRINNSRYYRDSTRNAVQESLFQFLKPTLFELYKAANVEPDKLFAQNVNALQNVDSDALGIPEHLSLSLSPNHEQTNTASNSNHQPESTSLPQTPDSLAGMSPPNIQPSYHPLSDPSQEFEDITDEANMLSLKTEESSPISYGNIQKKDVTTPTFRDTPPSGSFSASPSFTPHLMNMMPPSLSSGRLVTSMSSSPPIPISGRTPPIPISGRNSPISNSQSNNRPKRSYIEPPDQVLKNAVGIESDDLLTVTGSAESGPASLLSHSYMSISPNEDIGIPQNKELKRELYSVEEMRSMSSKSDSESDSESYHESSSSAAVTPQVAGSLFDVEEERSKKYIPYEKAIHELSKLSSQHSAVGKIEAVIAMSDAVCHCIDEYHQRTDTKVDPASVTRINADDLLSIFAYILIKTKVPFLISEIDFIEDFVGPNMRLAMPGYYLATLRAAVSLIDQLDHDVEKTP